MRESRQMPVPPGLAGMRVDAGLAKLLGLSRTAAAELAEAGDVQVDGVDVGKSDRLREDAWLSVLLPEVQAPLMPKEELVEGMDVLYHDNDLVAVHKPVGVAAHPSVGWTGPTVIGGLAAADFRISTSDPPESQGIVQRLDVGTSGVMVVACSERGYSVLKRAFKNREVSKTYHALVQGHPDPSSGTIDAAIGRHPSAGWRFCVRRDGKPAVTHYKTLEAFAPATLLEVGLETGRTHQIRVHFSALNHPCCGDPMYGSDEALAEKLGLTRQWLHAVSVGFRHPADGRWMEIECPYPDDLQHALDVLRAQ